VMMIKAVSEN